MFRLVLVLVVGLSCFSIAQSSASAAIVSAQQADVDQDGYVSVLDLALVAKNIGATTTDRVDVDRDGKVSILDLTAIAVRLFQPVSPSGVLEQAILTRGDHLLKHDITLIDPLPLNSWGLHGTEANKSLPAGNNSVAPWLVVQRDATQIATSLNAKFNIRNIRCYVYRPSSQSWTEVFNGLPGWAVSSDPSTIGAYADITPTREADGSYSFDVPVAKALHMASGEWPFVPESGGVLTTLEARVIGPDAAATRWAVAAGADYRTNGDYFTTNESGFGHLGLLTQQWNTYSMLSTVLTDDEVRVNPPPLP